MTSSVPSTPRNNFTNISRTPRKFCRRSLAAAAAVPQDTPDRSITEHHETPLRSKRRASKEKCNEISNLLTVAVRVRPMNSRELSCSSVYDTISVNKNELCVKIVSPGSIGVGLSHSFQYDHVFYSLDPEKTGYASQQDVFMAIGKPMLDNAFKGYNACLFAYGQTGSGKSYSMMGEYCSNIDTKNNETAAGVIPRFCYDLFDRIAELPTTTSTSVEISYFEIYNEKIYDLLAIPAVAPLDRRTPLKVREHPVWGPYVVNLSPHTVKSYAEIQDLLNSGNKFRATAATVMNEKSSRSHSIVSIELSVCEIDSDGTDSGRRSKISLVDLAGSERVRNNTNDDRHREGVSINQSLLTLGKVINSLSDSKRTNTFIPYRESTLTWLLRESLGGNSLTSMLATITPASSHVEETLATLRYACQARSIVNRAYVNENPHDRLIRELRAEVERLRALRQDYERTSITPITTTTTIPIPNNNPNNSTKELEELRQKLYEKEQHLEDAQKAWEQRFLETKQKQLQELAEAEKRKAELESHVRVMTTLDKEIRLSPYKSNFLEQLEDVLENDDKENVPNINSFIEDVNLWCTTNKLNLQFTLDKNGAILVKDKTSQMFAKCDLNQLKKRFHNSMYPEKFLNDLEWQIDENQKSMTRVSVQKYWQQICHATNALKVIVEDDEMLQSAFDELHEAVNGFQTALNKSKYRQRNGKTVKFQT